MTPCWSDNKIIATVTRQYVVSRIPPEEQSRLHIPLAFGDGLTDDTYLDWILMRGRKLFLILEAVGIPEWIFDAIDKSLDDDDLPIPEDALCEFNLSRGKSRKLEAKFSRQQFNYLIQDLGYDVHIDYQDDEVVPLKLLNKAPNLLHGHNADKVCVVDKPQITYTRKRVPLGGNDGVDKIHFILHLKAVQKLKHPHLIAIWSTYTQYDFGYILISPSTDTTLKLFLEDQPKAFRQLTKQERRETLISWIVCLTDALAFLHERGYTHEAIRPSNVFVSASQNVVLGEFSAFHILNEKKQSTYEREAYDFAAPEHWMCTATLKETSKSSVALPSGGRAGRMTSSSISPTPLGRTVTPPSKLQNGLPRPSSFRNMAPIFRRARTRVSTGSIPSSVADTSSSSNSKNSFASSNQTHRSASTPHSTPPLRAQAPNPAIASSRPPIRALLKTFATLPSSFPSDIFSLACIHLLLITTLLEHPLKNFTHARSKQNRSAGRGGAPADSSFHANMEPVSKWMEKMAKGARKKCAGTEEGCAPFGAVEGILHVLRTGMLRRERGERWQGRRCEVALRAVVEGHIVGEKRECCVGKVEENLAGFATESVGDAGYESGEWRRRPSRRQRLVSSPDPSMASRRTGLSPDLWGDGLGDEDEDDEDEEREVFGEDDFDVVDDDDEDDDDDDDDDDVHPIDIHAVDWPLPGNGIPSLEVLRV